MDFGLKNLFIQQSNSLKTFKIKRIKIIKAYKKTWSVKTIF
jgi:hypothetical protein